jgi:formamidopyrimidine-DNA glycosylase
MPELPEVETVRRGLAPVMEGAVLERLELRRADLRFPFPVGFSQALEGKAIRALARRAKYLLMEFEGGNTVIAHLGMSGSFRIQREAPGSDGQTVGNFHHERSGLATHDHVVFHLNTGMGPAQVIYNDPRRFGFMDLAASATLQDHKFLRDLGIEPTGNALCEDELVRLFAGKQAPLKAALLDQRLIAGLGNIYVCEAMHRSRLSPLRSAGSLVGKNGKPAKAMLPLAGMIRDVIGEAIAAGGSSLRDHRQADGSLGYFQHHFAVYGREGQPCPHGQCGGTIKRIVQSGRSTFYCPKCQK